jgi:hypothetical protein
MEDSMSRQDMIVAQARLVSKLMFVQDDEIEQNLERLEEQAERQFPREHKQIAAAALNLALGHRA